MTQHTTGLALLSEVAQSQTKSKGKSKGTQTEEPEEEEPATSVLKVKVRGQDSGTIGGAKVTVSGSASGSGRTDDRGQATFSGLTQGRVRVEVSADGWAAGAQSITLDDDREELSITLAPLETRLTVKVVGDEDGDRVAVRDYTVRVKPDSGSAVEKPASNSGSVVFSGLPRGGISVRVIATGWDTKVQRATLAGNEQTVEVVLEKQLPPDDPSDEDDED